MCQENCIGFGTGKVNSDKIWSDRYWARKEVLDQKGTGLIIRRGRISLKQGQDEFPGRRWPG